MQFRLWFATVMTAILLLAACGAPASTPATGDAAKVEQTTVQPAMAEKEASVAAAEAMTETMAMTDTHVMTDSMMMTDTQAMTESAMTEPAMTNATDAMMPELLPWQTIALTNARTGEPFTLADFAGKTVFVETMATWCTNCRQQLGNVKSAAARADGEQAVFIAISVETDLSAETLAQYADNNGFDWTFAVATPAMVQALAETFGQTIANPPATPHFLILPDGSHSDLVTGYESGDQILANLGQ